MVVVLLGCVCCADAALVWFAVWLFGLLLLLTVSCCVAVCVCYLVVCVAVIGWCCV